MIKQMENTVRTNTKIVRTPPQDVPWFQGHTVLNDLSRMNQQLVLCSTTRSSALRVLSKTTLTSVLGLI